ncbi:MAG: SDR family NAD(P)-dependent oxidoreductase [Bacteroidales bacterium]|nr:SDR family NAD(P)-dependent oxidoreductase [Bacteroidales bacterium]
MNKIVLISGATAGIGEALAWKFAENNYNLILTGRRSERLKKIKAELSAKFSVEILSLNFDIRELKEVEKAVKSIPENWQKIDVLINNAGLAVGVTPIQDGIYDDWDRMIDTNIKGLLYLSRNIIPFLKARQKGQIINIGSIAGKQVYPNGNVYCGTKAAVQSITEGMRIDLVKYGIKVTQIAPGAVETEFSIVRLGGDTEAAKNVYNGYKPLTAKDIANIAYYTTTLPEHVNINDILVTPTAQANAYVYNKK